MRQIDNALVRARTPDIIQAQERSWAVTILPQRAERQALQEQLVEEAREAAAADGEQRVTELADRYGGSDAILAATGLTSRQVRAEQRRRRAEGADSSCAGVW